MEDVWEGKFTGKEHLFLSVNMKFFSRCNVRKHKEIRGSDKYVTLKEHKDIRGSDKYVTLDISSKFDSHVSVKDIFKIIKEFEKIEKLPYEKKRPNHDPTESYFHQARQLENCMMRSDNLNWYDHSRYKEMTAPYSNVNVTNESESKHSIVNKPLLQIRSAKEN